MCRKKLLEIDKLKNQVKYLKNQLQQTKGKNTLLIEESHHQLRETFNHLKDIIIIFDINKKISFVNITAKNKLGFFEKNISGLSLSTIIHKDHYKKLNHNLEHYSKGERFDTVLVNQYGKNIFVSGNLYAIFKNDLLTEYQCVFYDITDRVKAEQAQSLFYQIANITLTQNDLEELYKKIYDRLHKIFQVKNISLSSQNGKHYECFFFINEKTKIHDFTFDVEEELNNYVFERGKSLIIYKNGIEKIQKSANKSFDDPIPYIWLGIKISTSSFNGIMSICNYDDSNQFNDKDLDTLEFIGNQIGLAIERKQKQDHLESREATLKAIFNSTTHEIWSIDNKYCYTSYNENHKKTFYQYYGVPIEIGKSIQQLGVSTVNEDIIPFWIEKYKEGLSGKSVNFQICQTIDQTKNIWIEVFINPIFLSNGRIEEISIIANDITDKKEFEKIIINSEEKFRSIFESFQDIYFRCNLDGIITMVSPSIYGILGYTDQQLMGAHVVNYLFSDASFNKISEQLKQEQTIKDVESVIKTRGKTKKQFLCNIRLIKGKENSDEIEVVAKDISQIKIVNKQLEIAKNAAIRSLKVKERFLANMSHEIRTPMNGTIGMIELLANTRLTNDQKKYVKNMQKSTDTLLNIVNNVLSLSKIEAGKMKVKCEPVQISTVAEKIYDVFSHQAEAQNNQLYYYVDSRIPQWLLIDETHLTQILSNLISNAIKFCKDKGNIHFSILLQKSKKDENFLKITVKDSGLGISNKDQKKIFKSFTQLDNSSTKNYGGTGLGLVICKELVHSMNGTIGVFSTPGFGSTFWFTLVAKSISEKYVKKEKTLNFTKQVFHQAPVVIIVDDNDINRQVASAILTKVGCKTIEIASGFDAIDYVKEHDFDIVLMDIQMPKMDGVKTLKKIRALDDRHLPIVAMTAYSMEGDKEKYLDAGFDDYISKPIDVSLLVKKIKKLLKLDLKEIPVSHIDKNGMDLIINQNKLQQLMKFGGIDLIKTTLKEFKEETQKIITDIEKHHKQQKTDKIKHSLHTLKGNSATLGIEKLSKQALTIENKIKECIFEEMDSDIRKLNFCFEEFKESSKKLFNRYE